MADPRRPTAAGRAARRMGGGSRRSAGAAARRAGPARLGAGQPCLPRGRCAGRGRWPPRRAGPGGFPQGDPLLPGPCPVPGARDPAARTRPRTPARPPRLAVLAPVTDPRAGPPRPAEAGHLNSHPATTRNRSAVTSPHHLRAALRVGTGDTPVSREGSLRTFLGTAPGVGKTYAMLAEG